jgi:hypothetical protein
VRQKALAMLDSWLEGDEPLADILPFDPAEAISRFLNALYPSSWPSSRASSGIRKTGKPLPPAGATSWETSLTASTSSSASWSKAGQYDKKILENMDRTPSRSSWRARSPGPPGKTADPWSAPCGRGHQALDAHGYRQKWPNERAASGPPWKACWIRPSRPPAIRASGKRLRRPSLRAYAAWVA